ncbi:MAG: phosphoadenylyl-sulfate reductase [Firmicutes bacterium]|nr:phosphoadenylyl-sulfate reductase [Alicyclobacillaceae bacterium]MCL6497641.1 phosphoadenylyl-sulfate reductase [Bacillota bacterium]
MPPHLDAQPEGLEGWPADAVVAWAIAAFGSHLALASSFGAEDMVLIDLAAPHRPRPNLFYLDTGLLFPETYDLIRQVERHYQWPATRVAPELTLVDQARNFGPSLWERDPDTCCRLRKVEPLQRHLRGKAAWMTGIRRAQTPARRKARVLEWDSRFGLWKVNPLVDWSWEAVLAYLQQHAVPHNPLHHSGYPSIGCLPCTTAVATGEDPRAGRWRGQVKTECGLHQ